LLYNFGRASRPRPSAQKLTLPAHFRPLASTFACQPFVVRATGPFPFLLSASPRSRSKARCRPAPLQRLNRAPNCKRRYRGMHRSLLDGQDTQLAWLGIRRYCARTIGRSSRSLGCPARAELDATRSQLVHAMPNKVYTGISNEATYHCPRLFLLLSHGVTLIPSCRSFCRAGHLLFSPGKSRGRKVDHHSKTQTNKILRFTDVLQLVWSHSLHMVSVPRTEVDKDI
jgi:hypothetical protein